MAAASRGLVDAIEECDVEIARLSCDASAGELDRLTARIGMLEAAPVAGPDRQELLGLLRRQLDLMQRMRVRCELISQQRAHRYSHLRGLWQKLTVAHESADDEGRDASASRTLVRELLDEISRDVGGESPPRRV